MTFEWGGFVVAPFVCYDLRFPEIFRAASRQGANLFVVMALWPAKRQQHWLTLLQARAIENQAYVIGVNRTGDEPKHSYPGWSVVVVDPQGVIIADAGERERILKAALDPRSRCLLAEGLPRLEGRALAGTALINPGRKFPFSRSVRGLEKASQS